jgi:hypothetical protein
MQVSPITSGIGSITPRGLVGDLIMNVRALGPDNPQMTLGIPGVGVPAQAVLAGGTLPNGSYFTVITQLNPWGESLGSAEQAITTTGGNNGFTVVVTPSIGAVAVRVYLGTLAGQENIYALYTLAGGLVPGVANTLNFTNLGIAAGQPTVNSSAFVPDSDGSFVSSATMYRWINDALRAASRITGGIQDAVGIASVSGQRRYVTTLQGQWLRLDQCFYDGWELDLGNKAETFRNRNLTANISISLMTDAQSDTTRLELYWTPSRTAGTASTNANILATDTNIAITGVSGWLLADGYALISDVAGTNSEVVSYSAQTGSQLVNCIRGWAGTQPFPFLSGASVTELNIELNGYRMPYVYSVGQGLTALGVPPGWEPFLKDWMLGSFRKAEQETDEGQKLQDGAAKMLEQWVKSNKPVAGPRQCRMYGDYGVRGLVPGGLTGGIVIP